jgi:Protein of unknown function (DUF998)
MTLTDGSPDPEARATTRPATARHAGPELARWLALGAVVGPVLFTVAWLVLGFLSPGFTIFGARIAPYSPISAGISGLGLGPTAPYMNAAFVLNGVLLMVGVVAALHCIRELGGGARWSCTVLLGLSPLGSIICGIFTLESPIPHYLGALLGFGFPVVSFLVTGLLLRRVAGWQGFGRGLLFVGSPLTLVLLVLYFMTFSPTAAGAEHGVAGLTERIVITEVFVWFMALGWLAFRREGPADGEQRPGAGHLGDGHID